MMPTKKNREWFESSYSTAAGTIVEYNPLDGYASSLSPMYGELPEYHLRGVAVSGSSAAAASTTPIKLVYGQSSAHTLTTVYLFSEPSSGMRFLDNLMGLNGGYFSIRSTIAHADGALVAAMWGD